jgi:hypothetical protein
MNFPRIYVQEDLPAGYDGSLRVLANLTTREVEQWYAAGLGTPGCVECAKLRTRPADAPDPVLVYCPACTSARQSFGELASLIYGPKLLGEDVSTGDRALAFFDNDDALPAELVAWLFVLPDSIRLRRTETIRKNARSSSGLTESS